MVVSRLNLMTGEERKEEMKKLTYRQYKNLLGCEVDNMEYFKLSNMTIDYDNYYNDKHNCNVYNLYMDLVVIKEKLIDFMIEKDFKEFNFTKDDFKQKKEVKQ
jgi:hypothetical protein